MDWSKAQNSARLVPGLLGAAGKALAGHRFAKWSFRALKALLVVSGAASGLKFTTDRPLEEPGAERPLSVVLKQDLLLGGGEEKQCWPWRHLWFSRRLSPPASVAAGHVAGQAMRVP